jgi:hypothetical protein
MQPVAIDQSTGVHGPSVGKRVIQEKYNSDISAMRCVYMCILKVKYKNSMSLLESAEFLRLSHGLNLAFVGAD